MLLAQGAHVGLLLLLDLLTCLVTDESTLLLLLLGMLGTIGLLLQFCVLGFVAHIRSTSGSGNSGVAVCQTAASPATAQLQVLCNRNSNSKLNVPIGVSWRLTGTGTACTGPTNALGGLAPSSGNCRCTNGELLLFFANVSCRRAYTCRGHALHAYTF
jgi:hypothetical protein